MRKIPIPLSLFSIGISCLLPHLAAEPVSKSLSESTSYPLIHTDRQITVDGDAEDWDGVVRHRVVSKNKKQMAAGTRFDFALQSTKDALYVLIEVETSSKDEPPAPIHFAFDTYYSHTTLRFLTPADPKAVYDDGGYWFTISPQAQSAEANPTLGPAGKGKAGKAARLEKGKGKGKQGALRNANRIISGLRGGYDSGTSATQAVRSKDLTAEVEYSDSGYTVEALIPWESMNMVPPSPGQFIGFDIGVPISDTRGKKGAKKRRVTTELSWQAGTKLPDQFGALVAVGDDGLGAGIYAAKKNIPWSPSEHQSDLLPVSLDNRIVYIGTESKTVNSTLSLVNEKGLTITKTAEVTLAPNTETRLHSIFPPGEIPAGSYTGSLTVGGHSSAVAFTIRGDSEYKVEAERILNKLNPRIEELGALVQKGKTANLEVSAPDATLAVAELFMQWIPADLGRDSMQELALREARQLEALIDPAIVEMRTILANPDKHPRGAWPSAGKITIRDSNIYGEKSAPMFLFGIRGFLDANRRGPYHVSDEDYELATRLGMNFFLEPTSGMMATTFPEEDVIDHEFIQYRRDLVDRHAEHGMAALCLLNTGSVAPWMIKKYPGLTSGLGHSIFMDISHPGAFEIQRKFLSTAAQSLVGAPNMTGYMIWGEMGVDAMSPVATEHFRAAMEKQYGSIDQLNAVWGSKYSDFTQVQAYPNPSRFRSPIENPAWYYDWAVWNQSRATKWLVFSDQVLKENDPQALTSAMISHSQPLWGAEGAKREGGTIYRSRHYNGVNVEDLSTKLDILEDDQAPQYEKAISERHAFLWEYPGMMRDLQHSIAPDKPMRDSEWHGIQPAGSENLPAEFMNSSVWYCHLHGLDMNLVWFWDRQTKNQDFAPNSSIAGQEQFRRSIVTQPQALAQWAKTNRVLQNNARQIIAFQEQSPAIHLLWSEPSAIHDVHYLDALRHSWRDLGWFGRPVGFLTEQMMLDGKGADCKLLIVPEAKYVSPGVREAIAGMADKGTKVVLIGESSLSLTPHAKPLTDPTPITSQVLPAGSVSRQQWDNILLEANIDTSIRMIGSNGLNSEPIEFRWVPYRGRKLGYLVNLGISSEKVTLTRDGEAIPYRSLLSKEEFTGSRDLPAMEVDLFEFD